MNFIQTSQELELLCDTLKKEAFITVDTEFVREKTFWPCLCLIQVAGEKVSAVIDALAKDIDLTPFFKLLDDENILKVMHSSRQDLEIFYMLTQKLPKPFFDTQIAAMVCGFGENIGYKTLCASLLDVNIDKSQCLTDWTKRPLAKKQIEYALSDVTYLRDIYEKLNAKLEKDGRTSWLDEEMTQLLSPEVYENDPDKAYLRFRNTPKDRRQLAIFKELAKWRDIEARNTNRPRKQIISDEFLAELAKCAPNNKEELCRMRGIHDRIKRGRNANAILEAILKAKSMPEDSLPKPLRRYEVPKGKKALLDLLHLLLVIKSEENDVAPSMIATSEELAIIAGEEKPQLLAMQGWRFDIFGKYALALKNGELSISYDKDKDKICVQEK